MPTVHFDTVENELRFEGEITQEKNAKGVPLVYIFVGIVLLPYLAKALLALRRDMVHGGIIVDTRGEKIDIDTDKSLPVGVIVVVTSEGTQLYERGEIEAPSKLVEVILSTL